MAAWSAAALPPKDFDRDYFMNAVQAQEYGIIDEVLGDASDVPTTAPFFEAMEKAAVASSGS